MNNLFAHTDDLVVPILVEWLDFADVARLDLACSVSKNDRGNIYRLFAAPQVVFYNNTKQLYKCFYHNNKRVLLGLLHRKIKLAKIEIDGGFTAGGNLHFTMWTGPSIFGVQCL